MSSIHVKPGFESQAFSWMILLLPTLAITTETGMSMIEMAIVVGTLVYAKALWQQRQALFHAGRYIVLVFMLHLGVSVLSLLYTGFNDSYMEGPLRAILVLPAMGLIVLTRPNAEKFWYGLFIGTFGALVLALYQRIELGMPRAMGSHLSIMFGDVAMAMALMSLASMERFAGTRLAPLPYLSFLAGVTTSILSGTRGGWIALILSFIPLYSYGRRPTGRKLLIVALSGIALIAAAYFVPQSLVRERIAEIVNDLHQYLLGNPESSVGARLEMWKAAWIMFAEHPLFGIGRANFNEGLKELIARGEIHPYVSIFYHAHNEMLNAMATQGIVGAVTLALLYGAPAAFFLSHLRRRDACQPYALAGLLLVFSFIDFGLTQALFKHHLGSAFYATTVSVLAGICMMLAQTETRHEIAGGIAHTADLQLSE